MVIAYAVVVRESLNLMALADTSFLSMITLVDR
jgi:hypothetical protein